MLDVGVYGQYDLQGRGEIGFPPAEGCSTTLLSTFEVGLLEDPPVANTCLPYPTGEGEIQSPSVVDFLRFFNHPLLQGPDFRHTINSMRLNTGHQPATHPLPPVPMFSCRHHVFPPFILSCWGGNRRCIRISSKLCLKRFKQ